MIINFHLSFPFDNDVFALSSGETHQGDPFKETDSTSYRCENFLFRFPSLLFIRRLESPFVRLRHSFDGSCVDLHSLFLSFSLNERHEQDIDKKIASSSDSPCSIIRRFPVPRDVISQSRYALMAVEKLHHPYIPSLSLSLALRLSPPCPPRKFHRQYLSWLGILFLLYNSSFIVKEKREVTG